MENLEFRRKSAVFCFTIDNQITEGELLAKLYLAQSVGINLGFNFKISPRGLTCKIAQAYIDDLVESGELRYEQDSTLVWVFPRGEEQAMIVDCDLGIKTLELINLTKGFSFDGLFFVVALHVIQVQLHRDSVLKVLGVDEQRAFVVNSLARFSDLDVLENFEEANTVILSLSKLKSL